METVFHAEISGWESWGRVFQSIEAFSPLLERIYQKEGLPFAGVGRCAPGTNAVFRVGDTVAKVFVPRESGMDSRLDFHSEQFGICRAAALGFPVPRLLAQGEIQDKYLFRYLILERIDGESLAECGPRLNAAEKCRIGVQLRQVADCLNTPCEPFNQVDILERCFHNSRWNCFPASFNREREEWTRQYPCGERVYVHGDLNPDNLLFDRKGRLYIIDFADGVLAPVVYEHALIAGELFRFDRDYLEGFFGSCSVASLAELCLEGLLLHDFGANVLQDRLGDVSGITGLAVLRERLSNQIKAARACGDLQNT